MGVSVLIYGRSGAGKSRSLKEFGEDEIFLVNVIGKPLPFPGKFRYTTKTDNYNTIRKGLSTMMTPGICSPIHLCGATPPPKAEAAVSTFTTILRTRFGAYFGSSKTISRRT